MDEIKLPSIPDSDTVGWIVAPAGRCVQFVAEQAKVNGTIQRALIALAGQRPIVLAARQLAIERGSGAVSAFDELLKEQESIGPWAQELVDSEYQPIHASMLIAIWSAIEVAIEDTAVLLLLKDPSVLPSLDEAGINLRKQLTASPNENTARRAVKALERRVRQDYAAGPAMVEFLGILGVSVKGDPETLERLTELNSVRNCLLHRAGIADSPLIAQAPGLGLAVGDRIEVTTPMMDTYYRAVSDFAVGLITAVTGWLKESLSPAEIPKA